MYLVSFKSGISPEAMYCLRRWEFSNLPIYGSEAGYLLFVTLASIDSVPYKSLKEMYLQMPFAESTVRLLLRNLERDGWIKNPQEVVDNRTKQYELTEKFIKKREEWLVQVNKILMNNEDQQTSRCQRSSSTVVSMERFG